MKPSPDQIGDLFQQLTQYRRDQMPGRPLNLASRPDLYKEYPDCPSVELPDFSSLDIAGLKEVLEKRRSIRSFSPDPILPQQLSFLLWASTGIACHMQGYEYRTAPSAGALYPIETYLVVNRVKGIEAGIYHYNIRRHTLEQLKKGFFGQLLSAAALGQTMCAEAAAVFAWSSVFERSRWKYRQRAYRYMYMDAGHVAENLALAATGIGLGSCQIGALFDEECNALIDLYGKEESIIYMSAVGNPG